MAFAIPRMSTVVAAFVQVHPHELSSLLYAFAAFFFLLSAYFMVLPLRDEAALSMGAKTLPTLFLGSLIVTIIAAPISSRILSSTNLPKDKGIVVLYRLFGGSLILFFLLYNVVPGSQSPTKWFQALKEELMMKANQDHSLSEDMELRPTNGEGNYPYSFVAAVRASFFVWVALLNLFTIYALWTRLTDVMSSEAASRLFGFIGAGATLGQLAGSLFAFALANLGPLLLLFSALSMELAAQCALHVREEDDTAHCANRISAYNQQSGVIEQGKLSTSPLQVVAHVTRKLAIWLKGFQLIIASYYLLLICAFTWLTALMSSFFYLEKAGVVAGAVVDPIGRRVLLAKINSLTAVFVLFGQLSVTGRFIREFGVTSAICASPIIGILNILMIAASPTSSVIALSEAFRKVCNL